PTPAKAAIKAPAVEGRRWEVWVATRGRGTHPWVIEHRERIGVGLQAVARADDPAPSRRLLAAGRLADDLGLDGFFLGDHPAYAPEAWLHLGALAVTTRRVRLGSVVLCAGYRSPVLTARLAADLDNISGGRLMLGLGIGWNATEFAQLGLPFPPVPERQAALAETITIVRGVWGTQPFTFRGRYQSCKDERVVPGPAQPGGPPLMIAGAGERVALRLVAEHADACNFGPGHATGLARSPEEVHRKLAVLRRHCEEIGRPYEEILPTHFTSWLMLGETDDAARAKLDRYYPKGVNEEQRHSRVATTPDGAVAYYRALAEAGMRYFVVQTLDAGDEETIRLLAEEVAPRLRALGPSTGP
ncbi:MAG: LLM class flavin-dependent oxidoreductase, partial [Chloroflexota bacterium]|nr:LLM class flavin-dependent oxidoreductase [Chloroflexota bacterium]